MTPHQKRLCPLTKRLAEDMKIRNLAQAIIDAYTYHARRFADFTKKPLDRVTVEDVRSFQLYLIEQFRLSNRNYSTLRTGTFNNKFGQFGTTMPEEWATVIKKGLETHLP